MDRPEYNELIRKGHNGMVQVDTGVSVVRDIDRCRVFMDYDPT